jgi:hypothetical protein
MEHTDTPPPTYTSRSASEHSGYFTSNSLTQSATTVISQILSSVGINNEMPYLVNDTETLCSICLEGMDEEEGNLFTVTECSHTYHIKCIAKWKKQSRKCPCCRGPLPDEIGPTNSSIRNLLVDEDVLDMEEGAIFKNLILCPLGSFYPLCLFSLCIALELPVFCLLVVIIFLLAAYEIAEEERNILSATCMVITFCVIYPATAALMGLFFILQICYALFRTLKFYMLVLMCKMRWSSAANYIVKRTLMLTESILNNLID